MKITDTLGRTLNIDVVVKAPGSDDWMQPLGYELEDGRKHLRVPFGPFALRVMSRLGIDILVHVDGKRLLASSVNKGIQYLEKDADGNRFYFGPQESAKESSAEMFAHDDATGQAGIGADENQDATAGDTVIGASDDHLPPVLEALNAPSGHGLVFVVARFANDPSLAGSQPPSQEYEISFQLQAPGDHEKQLAASLSKIVAPKAPPDPDNLVSMNPASNRPAFSCTVTGHSH